MTSLDFPKLRWAHEHLRRLQAASEEWFGRDHHRITSEPDTSGLPGRRSNIAFYVEADPLPVEFRLMVGDVLQAFRSGLDHLAFALAAAHAGTLSDEIAELSEFPIFGDDSKAGTGGTGAARFHQSSKSGVPIATSGLAKIQGMAPEAQAIIEGLQPYQRGAAFRSDPLWRLHELSRIDKHRLVHVVTADFSGVGMIMHPGSNWRIGPGLFVSGAAVVDGRTFISSIPVEAVDPKKAMDVNVQVALKLAFGSSVPLVAGEPVVSTLNAIYDHVYKRVLKPLIGFLMPPESDHAAPPGASHR